VKVTSTSPDAEREAPVKVPVWLINTGVTLNWNSGSFMLVYTKKRQFSTYGEQSDTGRRISLDASGCATVEVNVISQFIDQNVAEKWLNF